MRFSLGLNECQATPTRHPFNSDSAGCESAVGGSKCTIKNTRRVIFQDANPYVGLSKRNDYKNCESARWLLEMNNKKYTESDFPECESARWLLEMDERKNTECQLAKEGDPCRSDFESFLQLKLHVKPNEF